MSQILTYAHPHFILQISDRLVSISSRSKVPVPHDRVSNKALLFRAKNAIATIGYVGIAYLRDIPTDAFIAEALWGRPLPGPSPSGATPMQFDIGRIHDWPDMGQAVNRLKAALEKTPATSPGLSITLAGWQSVRKRNCRPIVIRIEKRGGQKPVSVDHEERWWPTSKNTRLYEDGGYLRNVDGPSIMSKLRTAASGKSPADAVERVLAETIRDVSTRSPAVGPDLLSILLPHPNVPYPAVVNFLPASEHQIAIAADAATEVFSVFYSPWIIGPGCLLPPSAQIGQSETSLAGVHVVIAGAPPPSKRILGMHVSQVRPRPP
jgi:hypothetical protein